MNFYTSVSNNSRITLVLRDYLWLSYKSSFARPGLAAPFSLARSCLYGWPEPPTGRAARESRAPSLPLEYDMNNLRAWCVIALLALAGAATAQDRTYTEGPVTVVTSIKVMDGQFQNYMNYLARDWRPTQEASKEAGVIVSYRVYDASPRREDDADLYLVTTYPNMAMFDGMTEKLDPIQARVLKMNLSKREEAAGKRTVMRTVMGSEMLRELVFN